MSESYEILPQNPLEWVKSRTTAYLAGLAVAGSGFLTVAGALAISRGSYIAIVGLLFSTAALIAGSVELAKKTLPERLAWSFRQKVKEILERFIALILLILSLPLLILVFFMVRSDGGPALIRHGRVGRHGEVFQMFKFRTMVPEPDKILQVHLDNDLAARREWATNRKLQHDPRLTGVGAFLRATGVDELPQLMNVLRGDMGLVGPRPLLERERSLYGLSFTDYMSVRPGITGLWQIDPDRFATYESRIRLDVEYIRKWTFRQDVLILLKTLPSMAFRIARRMPAGLRARHDQHEWIKHHFHNLA